MTTPEARIPADVRDDEILHRLVKFGETREGKPHYMAFYSSSEPWRMSTDRARYRSIEESLRGRPNDGIAALEAGAVRGIDCTPRLRVESVPENGNDAHAEIVAHTSISKNAMKTKICAKLADASTIVREPRVVPPP